MSGALRVRILGCGGSGGVPMVGNIWGDCDPAEPRNRRRRAAILLETESTTVLIDTGPEMREQLIDAQVGRMDAVVYTHAHADHAHGIDDLRQVNWMTNKPLPIYADPINLDQLLERFDYCFKPQDRPDWFPRPCLVPNLITGPFSIGDIEFIPFHQEHGRFPSLGFRIGNFAYSTDVVHLDDKAWSILEGVDTWIVDATRIEPHPVHAHLDLALSWIERLKPRRAYLTHMNHTMDYRSLMATLPPGVEPAYDGLVLEMA
ncbi:MAG: MBL fold metallo-hydrolase [Azospirillaceae bacterium]|nr:MBL fold metallo-hydrolase [Azospirillaceae bacterium]